MPKLIVKEEGEVLDSRDRVDIINYIHRRLWDTLNDSIIRGDIHTLIESINRLDKLRDREIVELTTTKRGKD